MASRRSWATFVAQARSAADGGSGSVGPGLRGESPSGSAIGLGNGRDGAEQGGFGIAI